MSAKAIREYNAKALLRRLFEGKDTLCPQPSVLVSSGSELRALADSPDHAFLKGRLVAKPDQLLKRRGKLGLIQINVNVQEASDWIDEIGLSEMTIERATGKLSCFLVEPFIAHKEDEECYVCIRSTRIGDEILFCRQGGVNVGDVDAKAAVLSVPIGESPSIEALESLVSEFPPAQAKLVASFISQLFDGYARLNFTLLEINPLVVLGDRVYALDVAAKLDQTAEYECGSLWGNIEFPAQFGREMTKEERHIAELDSQTGASLKLTVINPNGRIWTMVAGGGASVIYSDTIAELGGANELANYGEYSGGPSEGQTYEYAKTILDLMTRTKREDGKVLIIGGGIANFTNVAATFKGIKRAIADKRDQLVEHKVTIFVRRGGPNYQEGLQIMRDLGQHLDIPIHVYGPETHMTAVCAMALGKEEVIQVVFEGGNLLAPVAPVISAEPEPARAPEPQSPSPSPSPPTHDIFTETTKSIVYGLQKTTVQGMLDFDRCCGRESPSVVAIIYPFSGNYKEKFFWGSGEVLIPVYADSDHAFNSHRDASVLVNLASLRSAFDASVSALNHTNIKAIAIIAEGIPERRTKLLNKMAKEKNVLLIGPATVGGIKPGAFRIGNTGGGIDNVVASKLYRPGSVAYVSRSGGMSNELNNIISRNSDGVYEGVAIGGDRYPGSTFIDHLLRFQSYDNVKMLVLLGEVGGVDEYEVCKALKDGRITKPVVAWCIGTCADLFQTEVQFGHAGALAHSTLETARTKNKALKEAGAHVPDSFNDLGATIRNVFVELTRAGYRPRPEVPVPVVPVDYAWARELGLVRKPTSFLSTISDERGQELKYCGIPISKIVSDGLGIGGVISLLWFQRPLPAYVNQFWELCLVLTADHGPAVSGSHNTIVAARAGKDLISSLCSGLLTIGDRFGGALDEAARMFMGAYDRGLTPAQFVEETRKNNKLIMGIGHRVKSINNPDQRVAVVIEHARKHFPKTPLLDYALQVEKITTAKRPNLILNVDGAIGVLTVDLLRECGEFSRESATAYVTSGVLNGLFVVGRSIGLVGHFLDQNRLQQGLYRHPWDDIAYMSKEQTSWFDK